MLGQYNATVAKQLFTTSGFNDLSGIKTIDMAKTLVSKQSTCTLICPVSKLLIWYRYELASSLYILMICRVSRLLTNAKQSVQ